MNSTVPPKFLIWLTLLCSAASFVHAGPPDPIPISSFLTSWSFFDTNGWHSDWDYAPKNFTNLTSSFLGDGTTMVMDSTNFAYLRYNVTEPTGTNNFTVDL